MKAFRSMIFVALFVVLALAVTARADADVLNEMSISELKHFLKDRDVKCRGCLDRHALVERARDVRHIMSSDEAAASQLSMIQHSAREHLTINHIVTVPAEIAQQQQQQRMMQEHLAANYRCDSPQQNGTQYCYNVAEALRRAHQQ